MRIGMLVLTAGSLLLGLWGCNLGKGQSQAAGGKPAATADARLEGHSAEAGAAREHEHSEAAPHTHPPGEAGEEPGTVSLSPEAQANIGLTVEAAEERAIGRTLLLNATLQVHPDEEAFVSSRVQGKVTAVRATIGDNVRRGEPLVVLQSLQIAETPPIVEVPSPLDGVVLDRTVTVGETVDPSKSLFRVANITRLWVQAEVYETDLATVRVGQTARLRVTAYPDREFPGRVVRLADVIDPEKRTLRVYIEVANTPDRKLKPAMFGQVNLVTASGGRTVAVPNEAVQTEGPERFVFVKNGERFQRQNVVVGDRDDRYTAIRSGLVSGDEVVVRGAAELKTVALQPAGGGGLVDESKPHTH